MAASEGLMSRHVLVVDDEARIREVVAYALRREGFVVTEVSDGDAALDRLATGGIDVVVLDVMLPGIDGCEIARRLRLSGSSVPIMMLTARDSASDIVKGLDAGADDYLTKPFSLRVLLARLRALSRRAGQPLRKLLEVDDLTLDPASREVRRGGQLILLTNTEFRLLDFLMRRAGRAVSRQGIIEAVWGFDEDVEANTVDAFIKLLRSKLDSGMGRKLIQTVRGYGYILRDES